MKFFKFIMISLIMFFIVGCSKVNSVNIYKKNIPIYNENNTISITELDKIYEKFNFGFGGNELFRYLTKEGINTYRQAKNNESFLYTALKVEEKGILYIFLEKLDGKYGVSYLLLKNNESLHTSEDFDGIKIEKSKKEDVMKVDENTKYNTLYTSLIGTITTHFLTDDIILQIYYTTDSLLQVTHIKRAKKENSIGYIQGITDVDWY